MIRRPALHRWTDITTDTPMPLLERQRIIGERMMVSRVVLKKGCDVPLHSHDNEQISIIVSGRLRFGLGNPGASDREELEVGPGEVLHLPGGVPHSALALQDTEVLDLFSPVSERTGIDQRGH